MKSDLIWAEIMKGCSLALSAAKEMLSEGHRWLKPSIDPYGFQLLGVDYMIDNEMRPWLLEFNSSPSIMIGHDDETTSGFIYEEKRAMLNDLFRVIWPRIRTPDEAKRGTRPASDSEEGTEFIRINAF